MITLSQPPKFFRKARILLSQERGAAATEFAVLAPVLIFACLATIDIGLAISQKMRLDYSVRAASEAAIRDLGEAEVHGVLNLIASEHFSLASTEEGTETQTEGDVSPIPEIATNVNRFCACPESVSAAIGCSTVCTDNAKPYLYYELSASVDYEAILLPDIPLTKSLLVQVK